MVTLPGWPAVSGAATFQDIRRSLAGMVVRSTAGVLRKGILPADTANLVTGTATMNVAVGSFVAVLDRNGAVFVPNFGSANVLLSSAPASGSRWSIVYVKQRESEAPFSDGATGPVLAVVESTSSEIAARALLPTGALELAVVKVDAGSSNTNAVGVTISQTVPYTAMEGGTVTVRNQTELDAWTPRAGSLAFKISDQRSYTRVVTSSAPGGEWLPASPMFVARRGGTQSLGVSGWHGLGAYGTPDINDLGSWGSGALQVSRAGIYRIGLNVRLQNASSPMAAQVTKNSTVPDTGVQLDLFVNASATALSGSAVVPLAANDVIRGLVYTSVANSIDTVDQRGLQLSVELLALL